MAYKEAVIIPYTLFKQYEHLFVKPNHNIPSLHSKEDDFKLMQQEKLLNKHYNIVQTSENLTKEELNPRKQFILSLIKKDQQPLLKSIFEIIDKHPQEIRWNKKLEVIIENEHMLGTDVAEIFKFLTKTSIITREQDIPVGSILVFQKLLQIGVPTGWIAHKERPTRKAPTIKKTKNPKQPNLNHPIEPDDSPRTILQRAQNTLGMLKTPLKRTPEQVNLKNSEESEPSSPNLWQRAQDTIGLLKTPFKRSRSRFSMLREPPESDEERGDSKSLSNSWLSIK